MSENRDIIYIKLKQHNVVYDRKVTLNDVGSYESTNEPVLRQIKQISLHSFPEKKKKSQMEFFSVMKVIQLIHEKYPNLQVESIGEKDFIVEYLSQPSPAAWINTLKLVLLCVLIFFGSAFTIMAFNNDVSVTDVFDRFYLQVMGSKKPEISELEIAYSVGIAVGILVFFNHFGKKKFSSDPTPIQVEMNKYKSDMDDTLIANGDQKGHEEDVT